MPFTLSDIGLSQEEVSQAIEIDPKVGTLLLFGERFHIASESSIKEYGRLAKEAAEMIAYTSFVGGVASTALLQIIASGEKWLDKPVLWTILIACGAGALLLYRKYRGYKQSANTQLAALTDISEEELSAPVGPNKD